MNLRWVLISLFTFSACTGELSSTKNNASDTELEKITKDMASDATVVNTTHDSTSNNNKATNNKTTTGETTSQGSHKIVLKDLKAFPTAMGGGSNVSGGRGGSIHWVTTTDAGGKGSFQDALRNGDGNKTIMFAVGGSFPHNYHLSTNQHNITIAGQTAHDLGGVYIDNDGNDDHFFYLNTINSIWRYISTRGNRIPPDSDGDPVLYTHLGDTIFDHITDFGGNSSSGPMSGVNITVQYCLGTEATSADTQDTGFQSYQPGYDGPEGFFDYIFNAILLKSHRSPSVSGPRLVMYRIIGNYIYGWTGRHVNVYGTPRVDIYDNVYQESKSGWGTHKKSNTYAVEHQSSAGEGHGSIYLKNNWHRKNDFSELFTIDNSNVEFHKPDRNDSYSVPEPRDTPLDPAAYLFDYPKNPTFIRDYVLANAGAGVRYSAKGVETVIDFEKRYKTWAATHNEQGTRESRTEIITIPTKSRALSDFEKKHGFPESWAQKHGLGSDAKVHNATKKNWTKLNGIYEIQNDAGYTNLEIYLAELAGDFHMLANPVKP